MSDVRNPQQFFHVAPRSARKSIKESGVIDYRKGEKQWNGIDYPKGNYVVTDKYDAHGYAQMRNEMAWDNGGPEVESHDVYQVQGNKFHADPLAEAGTLAGDTLYSKQPLQVVKRLRPPR